MLGPDYFPPSPASQGVIKVWWSEYRFWLGVVCSAIFLALALVNVDWRRTVVTLQEADWLLICLAVVATVATSVTLAFRWRVLLISIARLPVRDTFSYMMIGYLANTILPLRLGDVVRAVLMRRCHRISISLVFGSIVLERTLDLLMVLSLALGVSLIVRIPPIIQTAMVSFAGGGVIALIFLILLDRIGSRVVGQVVRLPGFTSRMSTERLAKLVARFAAGLGCLRDGKQLRLVLLLSVLAWTTAGAATTAYIAAFHLSAPWYAGFFVLAVINLGIAIPSSPASLGVYHYLAVLALSVWVTDTSMALGYAIGTHGINAFIQILVGGVCLAREGVTLPSLVHAAQTQSGAYVPGTSDPLQGQ